jgi:hypothetical protein
MNTRPRIKTVRIVKAVYYLGFGDDSVEKIRLEARNSLMLNWCSEKVQLEIDAPKKCGFYFYIKKLFHVFSELYQ